MHILLLAPGISVHSQRFLQMLLDAGHFVTFVDTHNPQPGGADRYNFVSYPGVFGLDRLGLRTINRLGQWIKAARLRRIWQRVKPDIVHVHWVDARADHCAKARLHPLMLTCWGSDINNHFSLVHQDPEYKKRIAYALAEADHITADSPEVLERCDMLAGRKLPSSLFYFGINLEKFKPGFAKEACELRKKLCIPASAKVILSVRRLERLMEHHNVLCALKEIVAEHKIDAVILLHRYLARLDGYETGLRRMVHDLGVGSRLSWIKGVPNDQMRVLDTLVCAFRNIFSRPKQLLSPE